MLCKIKYDVETTVSEASKLVSFPLQSLIHNCIYLKEGLRILKGYTN